MATLKKTESSWILVLMAQISKNPKQLIIWKENMGMS